MNNIICARCGTEIGDYQYPTKKDHYERPIHGDYAHCVNGLRVELQCCKDALKIAAEGLEEIQRKSQSAKIVGIAANQLAAIQAAKDGGK